MNAQYYKIKIPDDDKIGAKRVAQFVTSQDDSKIIGFVSDVVEGFYLITLFKPQALPSNAIVIKQKLTDKEFTAHLNDALEKQPRMWKKWEQMLE